MALNNLHSTRSRQWTRMASMAPNVIASYQCGLVLLMMACITMSQTGLFVVNAIASATPTRPTPQARNAVGMNNAVFKPHHVLALDRRVMGTHATA